ncbi:MAG: 8-oxo-dGTP diphosphatase MutT [Gammaproteobacteria bacterium]|nr:8-oxo-dGTP diphosphatase MutT [Gammaproteobacteria bacterium]
MSEKRLHIIIGILQNDQHEFCLAQRPAHVHLGGLWEFSGGKLEPGETPFEGLKRELAEELGIEVICAEPYLAFPYDYPTHKVYLDFWRVIEFKGKPHGHEGQPIRWVKKSDLTHYDTPEASQSLIDKLLSEST